jgi:NodT family efflux transporter outer membrane factor (OMF) lipoprotein
MNDNEISRSRRCRHTGAVALGALLLAGCASMHGLAPTGVAHDASKLAATKSLSAVPVNTVWPASDWWKRYGDPQLDALMDEALRTSPTLEIAAARTRQALAAAQVTDAGRFPRVDASASLTHERFSERGLVPPPYAGSWQTDGELAVTLSWELDIWGVHREAYASAIGAERAAEVDAEAAKLALATSIAEAYAEMQHAFAKRDVANKTLADREAILKLTRDRQAAGLDSRVELKQAESALPATREEIIAYDERIAHLRNAIAALLGEGPDRGLAIARPKAALVPFALPSSLPADLVGRRPDLVAQRWRIESASHAIDSAKGEFYPNVNLAAFVGLSGIGAGNILTLASRTAGVTPALSLPIFDAGRLRGNLAGRDADFDVAVAQYNRIVVDAVRDVVDEVAAWRGVEAERAEQRAALATAREAYELALLRYREGLGNYLQVLSVEQPMLVQQGLEADLDARELALSVRLVRALGGGFAPPPALALNCAAGTTGGDHHDGAAGCRGAGATKEGTR